MKLKISPKVLNLPSHKKKAILATVSKLPIATSRAYTDQTIKKAFILNGQLDVGHKNIKQKQNVTRDISMCSKCKISIFLKVLQ